MIQHTYLSKEDPEIASLIAEEDERQRTGLELIPSENHASPAVMETLATTCGDKYAEGYPGRRYYAGNEVVDKIENLTRDRAKQLFGVPYVNVEPYSGSPANLAVYVATCAPGDTIMGLDLPSGGHLTHGWKASVTSQFWKSAPYHTDAFGLIDIDEVGRLAREHKPKLIWCGATAMPRVIDFEPFAKIADEVGAYLVADISHIAGLIVGGQHPSPVSHAHLVTTTTHKTLRGPRGAIIMVTDKGLLKDPDLANKVDRAIIPGLQGGPHMNTIAAIGVALHEASQPAFKDYARRIVENAHILAEALKRRGFKLVTDGTDNHLLLIDLTPIGVGRGAFYHLALERVGLYTNKNTIPNDPSSPFYPSGLRIGTPAATTRGMGANEMEMIADWIARVSEKIKDRQLPTEKELRIATFKEFAQSLTTDPFYEKMRKEVEDMCVKFQVPALQE
jgi:glycine hydroxymethyltransferase